jgi:hypothetical protein
MGEDCPQSICCAPRHRQIIYDVRLNTKISTITQLSLNSSDMYKLLIQLSGHNTIIVTLQSHSWAPLAPFDPRDVLGFLTFGPTSWCSIRPRSTGAHNYKILYED